MKDSKEIIDTEIKEWVESYDYKVDSDTCADVAEQIALDVANSLILSVAPISLNKIKQSCFVIISFLSLY